MNFSPNKKMVSQAISKPKDAKYVLKRLLKYLWGFKWLLVLALALTISSNMLALVGPKLSGMAIDEIIGEGQVSFELVGIYLLWMLILYLISSLLSFILSIIMVKTSQKVVRQMRIDVFEKISKLPISYFDFHQTGDILSKISYDIDTINSSLSSDVIMILSSVITVIGSFLMMLSIEPILVLIFVITIPLAALITKYMSKRNRKYFKNRSIKLGELNSYVEEKMSGLKTIKAYNQESNIIKEFDKINIEASEATYKAEYFSSAVGPSVNFINNLSLALISVFGSILYLYRKISIGEISSFVAYSKKFSGPINEIANILAEIQGAFAAAERVFMLLDEDNEIEDKKHAISLKSVSGKVDVSHIAFGYNEKMILNDVSFKAGIGQTIAIVGPTGSGKTTIINLLMRFYELMSGYISVDDIDITNLTKESLRASYAMVLQETWLFTGSIYDNVLYGSKNKNKDDVINACKLARIHSYIEGLPEGYDTILTEEGSNISKGQKQLLTIARAMLLNSQMLILDEATSNVDTKTEIEIQQAMLELMKDKTCFVIAHRLSTIINADLILVVKNGSIIESGNHEELLDKQGIYRELYSSQYE